VFEGGIGWENFFEKDFVFPAVAEVVFVFDFLFWLGEEVGDAEFLFVQFFVPGRWRVGIGNADVDRIFIRLNMNW
jgi:hypothetical protein